MCALQFVNLHLLPESILAIVCERLRQKYKVLHMATIAFITVHVQVLETLQTTAYSVMVPQHFTLYCSVIARSVTFPNKLT